MNAVLHFVVLLLFTELSNHGAPSIPVTMPPLPSSHCTPPRRGTDANHDRKRTRAASMPATPSSSSSGSADRSRLRNKGSAERGSQKDSPPKARRRVYSESPPPSTSCHQGKDDCNVEIPVVGLTQSQGDTGHAVMLVPRSSAGLSHLSQHSTPVLTPESSTQVLTDFDQAMRSDDDAEHVVPPSQSCPSQSRGVIDLTNMNDSDSSNLHDSTDLTYSPDAAVAAGAAPNASKWDEFRDIPKRNHQPQHEQPPLSSPLLHILAVDIDYGLFKPIDYSLEVASFLDLITQQLLELYELCTSQVAVDQHAMECLYCGGVFASLDTYNVHTGIMSTLTRHQDRTACCSGADDSFVMVTIGPAAAASGSNEYGNTFADVEALHIAMTARHCENPDDWLQCLTHVLEHLSHCAQHGLAPTRPLVQLLSNAFTNPPHTAAAASSDAPLVEHINRLQALEANLHPGTDFNQLKAIGIKLRTNLRDAVITSPATQFFGANAIAWTCTGCRLFFKSCEDVKQHKFLMCLLFNGSDSSGCCKEGNQQPLRQVYYRKGNVTQAILDYLGGWDAATMILAHCRVVADVTAAFVDGVNPRASQHHMLIQHYNQIVDETRRQQQLAAGTQPPPGPSSGNGGAGGSGGTAGDGGSGADYHGSHDPGRGASIGGSNARGSNDNGGYATGGDVRRASTRTATVALRPQQPYSSNYHSDMRQHQQHSTISTPTMTDEAVQLLAPPQLKRYPYPSTAVAADAALCGAQREPRTFEFEFLLLDV